ncbi:hypothetical protein LNAT_P0717 [Lebetimonas natsushimae]|uniref:GGDEF domain-containing protein n=1 Tax=Lebetimonas natsushimae TaxID=1936991 RepID=A0A292YDF0_9BACT|nr:hypothetical protein [Lebetimonas natsushimae]GAX87421.1 hypothetical protein LNAT_P0717 [Lebetimonas natsushimae]
MDKLHELPKEKLIEIIKLLYSNIIKDPFYDIYSKSFFIEYLKNILELYKRYQNLKINIIVCRFDANKISEIKSNLRKSDLFAKFDDAFVILVFQTMESGLFKIKSKLENILTQNCYIIDVNIKDTIKNVINKIEEISK